MNSPYEQIPFKTFFFTHPTRTSEEQIFNHFDEVIEKMDDRTITNRDRESVLAEIRDRKINDMLCYQIVESGDMNIFNILLENGMIAVHLKRGTTEDVMLQTVLRTAEIPAKTILFPSKNQNITNDTKENLKQAVEVSTDGTVATRDVDTVLAKIREQKVEKQIQKYEITDAGQSEIFHITIDGEITSICVQKDSVESVRLKTMLKSAFILDEVNVIIKGNHFQMRSRNENAEKSGKDVSSMIQMLHSMQNNNEIEMVTKTGSKNFSYVFETSENEKIRIHVDADNEEVVRELDSFVTIKVKPFQKAKEVLKTGVTLSVPIIAAVAIGLGVETAVVKAYPYVENIIRNAFTATSSEQTVDLETNFKLMQSYALRLKGNNLGAEDYYRFSSLVDEMIAYYDQNGKTGADYETLLDYKQLIDGISVRTRGKTF